MRVVSARILLYVFIMSVSLIQVIELGHGILHTFKNPLHHHQIRKNRNSQAHTVVEHHFPKMKFAHEMDEPSAPDNFIALAYGFCQAFTDYEFSPNSFSLKYYTTVVECCYLVHICPPTPPPSLISLA